MSNAPTVLMGLVPLIRTVVRSGTASTATTVTADDSGTMFVNFSTALHTYTIPTVALGAGKCWLFFAADGTTSYRITSSAANNYVDDTVATTVQSEAAIGNAMMVIGDGTYYYTLLISGAGTAS